VAPTYHNRSDAGTGTAPNTSDFLVNIIPQMRHIPTLLPTTDTIQPWQLKASLNTGSSFYLFTKDLVGYKVK
jgi:hypothetical protein